MSAPSSVRLWFIFRRAADRHPHFTRGLPSAGLSSHVGNLQCLALSQKPSRTSLKPICNLQMLLNDVLDALAIRKKICSSKFVILIPTISGRKSCFQNNWTTERCREVAPQVCWSSQYKCTLSCDHHDICMHVISGAFHIYQRPRSFQSWTFAT